MIIGAKSINTFPEPNMGLIQMAKLLVLHFLFFAKKELAFHSDGV